MFHSSILFCAFLVAWSCIAHKHAMLPNQGQSSSQIQSVSSEVMSRSEDKVIFERRLKNDPKASAGVVLCYAEDKTILEKRLKKGLKASAGVVLYYASDRQEKFVLLGRERADKCAGATWCELGGSVETGESFLQAAIRETEEESGGAYRLITSDVLNNGIVYYHENEKKDGSIREELYIFLKVYKYYPVDALCRIVSQQEKDAYREKDDFKWILLPSLLAVKENPCILQDIDGNKCAITLRNFFYEALQREPFREALASIS